jgi:hypothetical protein
METEFTLPCDMSEDVTTFWYDDGYVFSRINEDTGNRHYWEDIKAFRDWLNEVIAEEEKTYGD